MANLSLLTSDLDTIHSTLTTYFSDVALFLGTGVGAVPDITAAIDQIQGDNLSTMATQLLTGNTNVLGGAVADGIHRVNSLSKEIGMISSNKSSYYSKAMADLDKSTLREAAYRAKSINDLTGATGVNK